MIKSLLINQLRKYSPKEMKELGEYVHSPFFNKNQSVIKLFEYLKKQYPVFEQKKLEKKTVYNKIFPNVDYNDGFMRTIIFNLSKLTDDYLSYIRYRENNFVGKWYLLHELNEKSLDRQIEKTVKELNKEMANVEVHEADYYFNKFMIEYEYFYYLNRLNQDKIEKFINNTDVENMFNHLTYFYLLRLIKHYVYYLNASEICKINFKTDTIEEIIKNLNPEKYSEVPVISLYYNILMLHLKEDDISYFYKVKELVVTLEKNLNKYEVIDTYINLENFCKKLIRKGNKGFYKELFDILKIEIEKEMYGVQGIMSDKFYRVSVETALKLKEFEWVQEFMEKYKCKLPSDSAENTYNFSRALYEFASDNFNESLEFLSKVKYDDVYQKAELRCLTAQLFYELDMDESLYSHLDSFRHFLSNDKLLPEDRKEYFYNFIKFIRIISGMQEGNLDGEYLHSQIQKVENIYNKEWLLEKAGEIKAAV